MPKRFAKVSFKGKILMIHKRIIRDDQKKLQCLLKKRKRKKKKLQWMNEETPWMNEQYNMKLFT